jgi:hypothetical protein
MKEQEKVPVVVKVEEAFERIFGGVSSDYETVIMNEQGREHKIEARFISQNDSPARKVTAALAEWYVSTTISRMNGLKVRIVCWLKIDQHTNLTLRLPRGRQAAAILKPLGVRVIDTGSDSPKAKAPLLRDVSHLLELLLPALKVALDEKLSWMVAEDDKRLKALQDEIADGQYTARERALNTADMNNLFIEDGKFIGVVVRTDK